MKGILKEGGSSRRDGLDTAFRSVGAVMECCYYAFGENDIIVIADVPDNVTLSSLALTVWSSGLVTGRTTVLLTAEEMDEAARKSPAYRGPGQSESGSRKTMSFRGLKGGGGRGAVLERASKSTGNRRIQPFGLEFGP
ncbi:MAG: GYD domain-containing protein [Syntrophobacteraceae bacterium]|nr:GYD domain-containing protein [Syntrophobacteraceae bacterium]